MLKRDFMADLERKYPKKSFFSMKELQEITGFNRDKMRRVFKNTPPFGTGRGKTFHVLDIYDTLIQERRYN